MHIAEGFLPPDQCLLWYAVSAPFVIHGARAVIHETRKSPENKLLLGAAGAFTFVLSAIKLPSVTGSSSHPTGTGVGAILFKPPVMAFMGTIVLIFQALLLAHGGITTLGANVFSMAIVGPWAGYAWWALCRKLGWTGKAGTFAAVFGTMFLADIVTYCVTSFELALAYPDPRGGIPGAAAKFLGVFAVTQIPLAAGEGLLGVVIFRFLAKVARPQLEQLGVGAAMTATLADDDLAGEAAADDLAAEEPANV